MAFLEARIAEDEEAARQLQEASGRAWAALPVGLIGFSRWLPPRLLAECEAKREVVRDHGVMHTKWGTLTCVRCNTRPGETPWPCRTLRLLALPYSDHPDYNPAWRA